MWRPWSKSSFKIHDTYSPTRASASAVTAVSSSPSFSCSSFKDIQHLFSEDPSTSFSSSSSSSKKASRVFHRVRIANSLLRSWPTQPYPNQPPSSSDPDSAALWPHPRPDSQNPPRISIPGAEASIVVYFTSLRVVRSTFEDCRSVRSILRGFRVRIDERDLSMDSSFVTELHRIFGGGGQNQNQNKEIPTLPRVFIGGNYVGGAEEVRQLHEIGELKKLVQSLPTVEPGVCDECGGYRFVPCNDCHGSHKLYTEKLGFRSCTACNENGLIRCPLCSSSRLFSV